MKLQFLTDESYERKLKYPGFGYQIWVELIKRKKKFDSLMKTIPEKTICSIVIQ